MKKIFALIIVIALIFTLCSCKKFNNDVSSSIYSESTHSSETSSVTSETEESAPSTTKSDDTTSNTTTSTPVENTSSEPVIDNTSKEEYENKIVDDTSEESKDTSSNVIIIDQEPTIVSIPLGKGNHHSNIIDSQGKIAYSGEWIFYSNGDEDGALYKIKEDGTAKQRISADKYCKYINVIGDWIFYKCNNALREYVYDLVKIKIDGSERSVVTSSFSITYVYVCDKKLYYKHDNGFSILDLETGEKTLYNEGNYYMPYVEGDWVYFLDSYDSSYGYGKLCKNRLGGTEKIQLTDYNARKFNVYDGWVYYTDFNFSIRRVRVDGTQDSEVFSDGYVNMFNVSDGVIYAGGREVFKIELNGSSYTKFTTGIVADFLFTLTDKYIYYEVSGKTYKIGKDGQKEQLTEINIL